MTPAAESIDAALDLLRCVECGGSVQLVELLDRPTDPSLGPDGRIACTACETAYPLIGGTPRMLLPSWRSYLHEAYPIAMRRLGFVEGTTAARDRHHELKRSTADSFAYEWRQFGQPRPEWRKNFADYLRPHELGWLAGKRVLDVGTGSGRHSAVAAEAGARVVAVDLGGSIDVARRNLPPSAVTIQADAERLPFARGTFDVVMSIGVLHHLPGPEAALAYVAQFAKPGGHVHVYLYWVPDSVWQQHVLRAVAIARKLTVRLPLPALRAACYPLAATLYLGVVAPYRLGRHRPRLRRLVDRFPLQTYADYPFGVLVNDQFDRFSAPLERRFTRGEVAAALAECGLEDVVVLPNHGWIGDGRRPSLSLAAAGPRSLGAVAPPSP